MNFKAFTLYIIVIHYHGIYVFHCFDKFMGYYTRKKILLVKIYGFLQGPQKLVFLVHRLDNYFADQLQLLGRLKICLWIRHIGIGRYGSSPTVVLHTRDHLT
jgi:hypothetical protein